ncbi:transglutaminase-like cysteine peptidase [Hoeflea prorocentri]|uniref:Transglutaminase-like cysteine peptidase n=1 Tax=Hoeflea prorocentri TaxID=1922333 RepID=A0A9X3ZG50_9HYPH|nr:transglutaminase-like cysteine peptidase [Hoeflea prorocentri]MCY6380397.1 transglutaminase-like cysteine peptidase [Hoeflea prorocentri]MDA5398197.1 transglutaminase-like cysteine peptidase [Hoeflea prorocentri]
MKTATLFRSALIGAILTLPVHTQANAANMITTGLTSQPIGHYQFCKSNPRECRQRSRSSRPMKLTKVAWQKMIEINHSVNQAIEPRTDMEIFGVEEYWAYPESVGDCEDYVLLKRQMLMEAGFKPADLLITVVRQPDGSGHAVLTVRTDLGDYILDNMRNKVLLWRDTEYTYLKRQSTRHSGRWKSIEHGQPTSVGSIRK